MTNTHVTPTGLDVSQNQFDWIMECLHRSLLVWFTRYMASFNIVAPS
jgi:hypothetical protein